MLSKTRGQEPQPSTGQRELAPIEPDAELLSQRLHATGSEPSTKFGTPEAKSLLFAQLVRQRLKQESSFRSGDPDLEAKCARADALFEKLCEIKTADLDYLQRQTLVQPFWDELVGLECAFAELLGYGDVLRKHVEQGLRSRLDHRPGLSFGTFLQPVGGEALEGGEPTMLKRKALIDKYVSSWPNISQDLDDASSNGLGIAAKGPKFGYWYERRALEWARERGKIGSAPKQVELLKVIHRINR